MKPLSRTRTALTAVLALTVLPAGAAFAQEDCEVVAGEGSAAGDVVCPDSGVGGEVVVEPGRFDRPDAAPADEDAGAPAVASTDASTDAELAATGAPADVAAAVALAALALGGGALVATRRRTRTDS